MIIDRRQIVCLVSSAQQHLGTPHFGCGNIYFLFFRIQAKIVYIYNKYTKWKKKGKSKLWWKNRVECCSFCVYVHKLNGKACTSKAPICYFFVFCFLPVSWCCFCRCRRCRCRCRHCCCCYSFFKCIICAVAFAIAIAIDCYSVEFLYNRSPHITFLAIIFKSLETFQMKCFT